MQSSLKNSIFYSKQVVEDGYEFFAKRQLVTLFSAPNYCGEFDNAGGMMSVDETLMCSFQILKPSEKKAKYQYGGMNTGRPVTPPRTAALGTGGGVNPGMGGTGMSGQGVMGGGVGAAGMPSSNLGKNTPGKK